ncbi:MAG: hypothetical protein HC880_15030, partial [Bacteroidia bacterium]|nr:hypothetical protein [Bacteroidia bacterium]
PIGARDAWVKILGNGRQMTLQYENIDTTSNPMIVMYTAIAGPGPIDCGFGVNGAGNNANEFACANNIDISGRQTESISFNSESGRLYLARIIDLAPGSMNGTMCFFSGSIPSSDCNAASIKEIDITATVGEDVDVGKCNVQFNVLNTNACTGASVQCIDVIPPLYINAGGPSVTLNGIQWQPDDQYTSSGSTFVNSNSTSSGIRCNSITNASGNTTMYRTERYAPTITYNIPVTPGAGYEVKLYFAEIYYSSVGQRILRAEIEGAEVLSNYDIIAQAGGRCRARVETFSVTENGDGNLNIIIQRQLGQGTVNDAKISGISIVQTAAPRYSCSSVAWAKFTTGNGTSPDRFPLPDNNITVQYDNSNNHSLVAPDVSLEIYRELTTFDCNDPATYEYVGCSDIISILNGAPEGIEEVNFSIDQDFSETYYIRVVNKDPNKTAFGKLCIFYGETIARPTCNVSVPYGDINGTWQNFKVPDYWTDIQPTDRITEPPCVLPGGSNPASPDPPIVSNGWLHFYIPPMTDISAVTVQFDNAQFSSSDINSENGAIAVYEGPNPSNFSYPADPAECSLSNLILIDCANNVWRGTESVSILVEADSWYYVRVMNVKNEGKDMPGRVRIFKFTSCTLGEELVVDGNFGGWGTVDDKGEAATATSYWDMNDWEYSNNPIINAYNSGAANLTRQINRYARFATDYGYLFDEQGTSGSNTFQSLRSRTGEFNPEGRYAVSHQAITRKGGGSGTDRYDWYSYGNGYTGYGGFTYSNYCASGSPQIGNEPCIDFGSPSANLPALIPHTADANYMIVNGWWRQDGLTNPGKVWCQTINVEDNAGVVRYYVFSAWFQNLISPGVNLDVPQLRVTICDMESPNPAEVGIIGNAGVVTAGSLPSPQFDPAFSSDLPGVSFTPQSNNPDNLTYHYPEPPLNANMRKDAPIGFTFGAARPCNMPGEANNARIKTLGSDFYVPETPDQWQLIRCIYRAPGRCEAL